MKMEHMIRIIAGTFVLVSLALGTWVNHNWYWFTTFVGGQPASIRIHKVVPDGRHPAETGSWDAGQVLGVL